jgi:hypothetical protein
MPNVAASIATSSAMRSDTDSAITDTFAVASAIRKWKRNQKLSSQNTRETKTKWRNPSEQTEEMIEKYNVNVKWFDGKEQRPTELAECDRKKRKQMNSIQIRRKVAKSVHRPGGYVR